MAWRIANGGRRRIANGGRRRIANGGRRRIANGGRRRIANGGRRRTALTRGAILEDPRELLDPGFAEQASNRYFDTKLDRALDREAEGLGKRSSIPRHEGVDKSLPAGHRAPCELADEPGMRQVVPKQRRRVRAACRRSNRWSWVGLLSLHLECAWELRYEGIPLGDRPSHLI